jgi:hypothetical protein
MKNDRRIEIFRKAIRQAQTHARNRSWERGVERYTVERLLDQAALIVERDETSFQLARARRDRRS